MTNAFKRLTVCLGLENWYRSATTGGWGSDSGFHSCNSSTHGYENMNSCLTTGTRMSLLVKQFCYSSETVYTLEETDSETIPKNKIFKEERHVFINWYSWNSHIQNIHKSGEERCSLNLTHLNTNVNFWIQKTIIILNLASIKHGKFIKYCDYMWQILRLQKCILFYQELVDPYFSVSFAILFPIWTFKCSWL